MNKLKSVQFCTGLTKKKPTTNKLKNPFPGAFHPLLRPPAPCTVPVTSLPALLPPGSEELKALKLQELPPFCSATLGMTLVSAGLCPNMSVSF